MSRSFDQLRTLARICRGLGGQFKIVSSQKEWDALFDAREGLCMPHTVGSRYEYGIRWDRKIVYAGRNTTHIGFVIHEAGHVFADRHPPNDAKCVEWEWLGWEITVARQIGAMRAWSIQNGNYHMGEGIDGGVGKNKDWSDLTAKERQAIITDRVAHAQKVGLIGADGSPRSIR